MTIDDPKVLSYDTLKAQNIASALVSVIAIHKKFGFPPCIQMIFQNQWS